MLPLSLLSALALPGYGFGWTGRVVDTTDGDAIRVLCHREEVKMRLASVDAAEKRHAVGRKAMQFLSDPVYGKTVEIEAIDKDRYGTVLGRGLVDGVSVQRKIVRAGRAWWDRKCAKR